jgi:hypothetical protein
MGNDLVPSRYTFEELQQATRQLLPAQAQDDQD